MDWSAFFSTLTGAGVSIITSLVVFWFTSSHERAEEISKEKKVNSFLAFRGLQKLISITNDLTHLKRHIDDAFSNADKNGLEDADPYVKIQVMVGAKVALEPIAMEEMFFLVNAKVAQLMAEVDLIYRRALNTDSVVEQFNRMKLEFGNFIEERTSKIELGEGTRAAFELSGKDVKLADLRGGAMNNLVGQMLEHLESDCAEAKRISQAFLEAARNYFGSDFPDVKLEWRF